MKIEQVRVQNYKSILDSKWVDIEDDVTTLVGANEAGKTNFLEALSKFKTGKEIPKEDVSDYVDEETDDENSTPIVSLRLVNTHPAMFADIKRFRKRVNQEPDFATSNIIVNRFLDGSIRYSVKPLVNDNDGSEISDHKSASEHFLDEEIQKLRSENHKEICTRVKDIYDQENNKGNCNHLLNYINSFLEGEVEQYRGESNFHERLSTIRSLIRGTTWTKEVRELAPDELTKIPNFEFFKNIDPIPEKALRGEIEPDCPYRELLDAVGMDVGSLEGVSLREKQRRRDEASNQISARFDRNWNQADVRFALTFIDGDVTLRIYEETKDGEEEIGTLPSDRSQGFRWFLSFFCHLLAREEDSISDSIILLDDPGAYLHPEGHKNLKQALAELGDENQVLYSTHSPYMIDKNHLNRVRTVRQLRDPEPAEDFGWQEPVEGENEQRIGTVVTRLNAIDSPVDDSLEPVRMALGASYSDSLFASKKTILVEGHDDRLILEGMSEFLGQNGGPTLDEESTIIDCGGASKVDYLSRIVDSQEFNYTVVLDGDKAGQDAVDDLEGREFDLSHIHLVDDVMDDTEGSAVTIEDLFSTKLYCEIAAEVHDDDGLSKEDFMDAYEPPNKGVVKEIDSRIAEARGRAGESTTEAEDRDNRNDQEDECAPNLLRKIEIARRINRQAMDEDAEDAFADETVERFEELIENVNASLASAEDSEDESEDEVEAEAVADDD